MSRSKGKKKINDPARQDREALLAAWGADVDPDLLDVALTHRSWSFEHGGIPTNERLEFLGDSVLSIVVTERLYRDNPDEQESALVPIRAATVSEPSLATIARDIKLNEFVLLGNGELVTGGRDKDSILADAVEALIAATYLSVGMEETRKVIEAHTAPLITRAWKLGPGLDWKTSLQTLAYERSLGEVRYEIESFGPDHAKRFVATAIIAGEPVGVGEGTSRQKAEIAAAEKSHDLLTEHRA